MKYQYIISSLVTIVALSVVVDLKAQNWAPTGSFWSYSLPSINPRGDYHTFTSERDTTINGLSAKIVVHRKSTGDFIANEIIHDRNDSVFYYQDGKLQLLYSFAVNKADTVSLNIRSTGRVNNDTILDVSFVVRALTSMNVGGTSLRVVEGDILVIPGYENDYNWPNTMQYVDKVGTLNGRTYLIPTIELHGVPETPRLRCYQDSNLDFVTDFWKESNNQPCKSIVGVTDLPISPQLVKLFPNPCKNTLNIDGLVDEGNYLISIYNSLGKLSMQFSNTSSQTSFDVSNLGLGFYTVRITNQKEASINRLLIKE